MASVGPWIAPRPPGLRKGEGGSRSALPVAVEGREVAINRPLDWTGEAATGRAHMTGLTATGGRAHIPGLT